MGIKSEALHWLDWLMIGGYLAFSLGVGVYFSRRAAKSTEEYFLSGRSLPWWVVGTSMVATTFAADTPLAITEFVRGAGIWQNWFWWNLLLSGLLGVFLFARLWRRANVLTDNEFIELRYSGRPASFLRGFKAAYFALLYNFIVMGWVINAMASVVSVVLTVDRWIAVWGCVGISLLYAILSGFWGVVVTDFVQFLIAMIGSILLAWIAVEHVGGMELVLGKIEVLQSTGNHSISPNTLRFVPPFPEGDFFSKAFWESPFSKFLVFLTIMWWSTHNTDGGGYIIQRMSSAKDERHAFLATLWFNIAHYALRVWPWVVVALVSIIMFPTIPQSYSELGSKAGYPLVLNTLLGPGLRGLLVVSFLAAFMSTIDTHLNWGSSYLVNDIYKRFIRPREGQAHYVVVSKVCTVLLMAFAALVAMKMQSISKAWEFIFAMGAGIGLVLILRWFWWRINAWSEITALVASILTTLAFEVLAAVQTLERGEPYSLFVNEPILFGMSLQVHHKLLIVVPVALVSWIGVTFLTNPEPPDKLRAFYRRVYPGGWWGRFVVDDVPGEPVSKGFLFNWLGGVAFVYGTTFCIGHFIFGNINTALLLMVIAGLGFWVVWNNTIRKLGE